MRGSQNRSAQPAHLVAVAALRIAVGASVQGMSRQQIAGWLASATSRILGRHELTGVPTMRNGELY
jgi:hypothetical protein